MKMSIYKKTINVVMVALLCLAMLASFGTPVKAQSNTAQSEQIKTLLALIQQLQSRLAQMQGGGSTISQCIQLSRSLFLGTSDSETGGEVSKLQQFLTKTGHYTYGKPTGYFGPATQMAVQAWQKTNGVVSNGSPETTGFGVTGPSTRSAMARSCTSTYTPTNRPVVDVQKPTCTIKTSDKNPNVGEKFTITWTTDNISNPAFNEGMKAGGSYNVDKQGKLSFEMSSAYTATFGISEQLDVNEPLCSVTVTSVGDDYAELDVKNYSESTNLVLNSVVLGKKLLSFTVDADKAEKDVTLTEIPVYIGLPYGKAGDWRDLIKNVILVSEKTQQSVSMSASVETNLGGVQLNGIDHDEILVTFDLSNYEDDFTIPKGVAREFTIIADFNPASEVAGFGAEKGISAGYVQAVIGEVDASTEVKRDDVEGPVIYVKGNSY